MELYSIKVILLLKSIKTRIPVSSPTTVLVRDHDSLDQGGKNRIAEIWLDYACILKIAATEFDDELDIECERIKLEEDAKIFGLRSFKDKDVIY